MIKKWIVLGLIMLSYGILTPEFSGYIYCFFGGCLFGYGLFEKEGK